MTHCSRTVLPFPSRRARCGCRAWPPGARPSSTCVVSGAACVHPAMTASPLHGCTVVSRSPWNTIAGTIRHALFRRSTGRCFYPAAALAHRHECRGQIAGRPAGEPRMHIDGRIQIGIGATHDRRRRGSGGQPGPHRLAAAAAGNGDRKPGVDGCNDRLDWRRKKCAVLVALQGGRFDLRPTRAERLPAPLPRPIRSARAASSIEVEPGARGDGEPACEQAVELAGALRRLGGAVQVGRLVRPSRLES